MNGYKDTKPAILIKHALDIIHEPGSVFEVRIPKTRVGTISGYFNDTAIAAALIAKENGKHSGIYVTANPVNNELLARQENRFEYGAHQLSADADIIRRRWFLLDLDPKRPAGISSTDAELEAAFDRAETIRDWLTSIGWPQPLIASSGNGVHLMYRVDEPNDDDTRTIFEFATKMLSAIFTDDVIDVDTTAFNACRVWKIYGTISAKGSDTKDRPHRVAAITKLPNPLEPVPRGLIENVARPLKEAKSEEFKDMTGEYIQDMVKWLSDRGQTVTSGPRPMFGHEGQKWTISKCPFNNHTNPMVGLVNNRPVFRCLHHSCSAFKWKEFREKIDPTFKDPDTVFQRLRDWCNGTEEEIDQELLQSACSTGKKIQSIIKKLQKECPRPRVNKLEEFIATEKRRFQKEVLGDNTEKGNIVGLINKVMMLQAEGIIPMFWTSDYDHQIRIGTIGDIEAPRYAESDEISLLVRFHGMGDSWVKQTHCGQIIKHLAETYKVNPLKKHLKSFRWDGVKRLDTWLHRYLGCKPGAYTEAIGRKWLISAVARAMEPGCQADHMLILEGKQGIGKSQALRIIGGAFYTEYSGVMKGGGTSHKDLVATICGKLIVEMSELATIRKADMEALKAILTTPVDDQRMPYERSVKAYPRTCVFGGTTNEIGQSYIADITGARRFWPALVGEIFPPKIALLREDRDQLWAEAVVAYEDGEDWYSVPAEEVAAEQQDRQITIEQSEPWFVRIRNALTDVDSYKNEYFSIVPKFVNGQEQLGDFNIRAGDMHVILSILLQVDISRQGANDVARLQKILRQIGFKKTRPYNGWKGATYAYDLTRDAVPHLWPAIGGAANEARNSNPLTRAAT